MSTVLDEIYQDEAYEHFQEPNESENRSKFSSEGTNFPQYIRKIENHCKEIQRCRNNNFRESLRLHHNVIEDFQLFLKIHVSSTVQECISVARIMGQIAPHFLNQLIPIFYSKINCFDVPHFVEVLSVYCNRQVLDYDFFQLLSSKIHENIHFLSAKQIMDISHSMKISNFRNKSFCRALLKQSKKIIHKKYTNQNVKKQTNRILENVITYLESI